VAHAALEFLVWLGTVVALFLASTVAFDAVHWTLHFLASSRHRPLRAIGGLHQVHHRFLDRELVIHEDLIRSNLTHHVVPEFLTQAATSLATLLFLPAPVVLGALGLQTLVFLLILRARGMDLNHRGVEVLRAHKPFVFCLPEYHALHHVHPEAHFSSWIKLLDALLRTGTCLSGRRVALTGAETRLGRTLRDRLAERGASAIESLDPDPEGSPGQAEALAARLRETDVLVLCHAGPGRDAASTGPDSYVGWVERARAATRERQLPIEVWAVSYAGGEPDGFVPHARRFLSDPRVIFRHVVLPATGAAGPAPPEKSVTRALSLIRRGFHHVPARRGAAGLLEALRLRFPARPA
jgi:hypothetical protein